MNRIDRLVAILTTLQSKKYVTSEFIAHKYEISERTVYRDLKALGEIGVPINYEVRKGYSILQGFFLPPVSLSSEEANSLILFASLSERFGDQTSKKHIENAINKIKAVLKTGEKYQVEDMMERIKVCHYDSKTPVTDHLSEIQNAIAHQRIIEIKYLNNENEISRREVEPIGLTFYSNQWHLIAWCWLRKSYRDFKINNILQLFNSADLFRKEDHIDLNSYIKSLKQ